MPRIDFKLWDRVYILKLICTTQMTYSSFLTLIYLYLIILQSWTCEESDRSDIMKFKLGAVVVCILEFGLGTLLAFAANMTGNPCRRRIIAWLILETFLVPTSISLLMQLYYRILKSALQYTTDPHYRRANIAQVCFLLCQYIFIAYALDFLVHTGQKPKTYDPSIRPESVYAPTDPQITTTESRHIRLSQSFLFQPSSSRKVTKTKSKDEISSSSSSDQPELRNEERDWDKPERNTFPRNETRKTVNWMKDEDMAQSKIEQSRETIHLLNKGIVEENNDTIPTINKEKEEEEEELVEEWTANPEGNNEEQMKKKKHVQKE